ncbi:hypothetical protein HY490_04005 [Candidatus Woesearchaeota archaeon]|nr:hypothetical protein [Candidatus Woesearchaeota archaeon]
MDKDILAMAITVVFIAAIVMLAAYFTGSITGKQVVVFEQTLNCPLPDRASCDTCCKQIGGRSDGTLCRYGGLPAQIPNSQQSYNSCVRKLGYSVVLTK